MLSFRLEHIHDYKQKISTTEIRHCHCCCLAVYNYGAMEIMYMSGMQHLENREQNCRKCQVTICIIPIIKF